MEGCENEIENISIVRSHDYGHSHRHSHYHHNHLCCHSHHSHCSKKEKEKEKERERDRQTGRKTDMETKKKWKSNRVLRKYIVTSSHELTLDQVQYTSEKDRERED